jgi:protein SCO1/2
MHDFLLLSRRAALGCALALPWAARVALASSADSVYALPATLTDQRGRTFELASLRGTPVLFSMFYTSCEKVCPVIFEAAHATLRALPTREAAQLRVLMVSFDPEHDSVPVLQRTAEMHDCDERWRLARTDAATVRALAALWGVQYRRLPDGEFNHSSQLGLLDRDGRISAKTGRLDGADVAFIKSVRAALQRRT